jgi:hypothetical protein
MLIDYSFPVHKEGISYISCPDDYAIKVPTGHYIKCEDYNVFQENWDIGYTRTDLYIDK